MDHPISGRLNGLSDCARWQPWHMPWIMTSQWRLILVSNWKENHVLNDLASICTSLLIYWPKVFQCHLCISSSEQNWICHSIRSTVKSDKCSDVDIQYRWSTHKSPGRNAQLLGSSSVKLGWLVPISPHEWKVVLLDPRTVAHTHGGEHLRHVERWAWRVAFHGRGLIILRWLIRWWWPNIAWMCSSGYWDITMASNHLLSGNAHTSTKPCRWLTINGTHPSRISIISVGQPSVDMG